MSSRVTQTFVAEDSTTGIHVMDRPREPGTRPREPWWWTWGWAVLACVLVGAILYDRLAVTTRIDAHLVRQGQEIKAAREDLAAAATMARQAKGAAEATQAATLGLKGAIRREVTAALENHEAAQKASRHYNRRPTTEDSPSPKLSIDGDVAVASVPITGSTEGMIHYSLKNPSGMVVKLPHAQSLLPQGHYWLRKGGFKVVWVEGRPDGLALRFIYDNSLPRQEMLEVVEVGPEAGDDPEAEGAVRVRLRKP